MKKSNPFRSFLKLRQGEHRLERCGPAVFLCRVTKRPIMSYRHLRTGNLVIGEWINRRAGVIRELAVMDPILTEAEVTEQVRQKFYPSWGDFLRSGLAESAKAESKVEQDLVEADAEEIELIEWARHHNRVLAADHPMWDTQIAMRQASAA